MDSKLILAHNIKLDKSYANVLSFDNEDMLELVQNNAIFEQNNYNYIDYTKGEIKADADYTICINSNYLAFQNPRHGNKWYFAFIDDVVYKSSGQCIIKFTVDVWSTFFGYWSTKPCFVIREHVNDDTVGKNTVPENVTTGDYVIQASGSIDIIAQNPKVVMSANIDEVGDVVTGRVYNGLPSGFGYFKYDLGDSSEQENFRDHVNLIQSRNGNLNQLFVAPNWLLPGGYGGGEIQQSQTVSEAWDSFSAITGLGTNYNNPYVPVNKKLLTYPFCFYKATNLQGQDGIWKNELWHTGSETHGGSTYTGKLVKIIGALTSGCSIRMFPLNYDEGGIDVGINAPKFPQLNWATDPYINWLTQQGINQIGDTLSSYISNPAEGIGKTSDLLSSSYQAYITSPQAHGNLNAGDVMYSGGFCNIWVMIVSIKEEFAKQIDKYFSRYGYKVNDVKTPNIYGRSNFNYIEIGKDDCIGYGNVPPKYMEEINNICRQGVTIWHNHTNLGNYNVTNSIVS